MAAIFSRCRLAAVQLLPSSSSPSVRLRPIISHMSWRNTAAQSSPRFLIQSLRNYAECRSQHTSPNVSRRRPRSAKQVPTSTPKPNPNVIPLGKPTTSTNTSTSPSDPHTYHIPGGNLLAKRLAHKSTPTVLYVDAPSNVTPFVAAAIGGLLMGISLVEVRLGFFFPNHGIWWLVPWMSLPIYLTIFSAGVFFATRRLRPISTITTIGGRQGQSLKLTFAGREGPTIPGTNFKLWDAMVEECAVGDVVLKKSLMHHALPVSPRARAAMLKTPPEPKMRELGFRDQMLRPIRNVFRWPANFVKDNVLEEGQLGLFVKGNSWRHKWSMDVKQAWMLDGGKPIEDLFLKQRDIISPKSYSRRR